MLSSWALWVRKPPSALEPQRMSFPPVGSIVSLPKAQPLTGQAQTASSCSRYHVSLFPCCLFCWTVIHRYIASADLDALFVHAGFVPGTRLSEQDPLMMISMRSITPDGVVTSNHLAGKGWARWVQRSMVHSAVDHFWTRSSLRRPLGLILSCGTF